jgi:hypothetical protein
VQLRRRQARVEGAACRNQSQERLSKKGQPWRRSSTIQPNRLDRRRVCRGDNKKFKRTPAINNRRRRRKRPGNCQESADSAIRVGVAIVAVMMISIVMATIGLLAVRIARIVKVIATWQQVQTGPQERNSADNRQQHLGGKLPKKSHKRPLLFAKWKYQSSGPTSQNYRRSSESCQLPERARRSVSASSRRQSPAAKRRP